jgi:dihydroxyacetone kinase
MADAAGRSSYVPEAVLRDVPDPGARAVALWLGAVAKAFSS